MAQAFLCHQAWPVWEKVVLKQGPAQPRKLVRQWKVVLQLLQRMQQESLQGNVKTYNVAIRHLGGWEGLRFDFC